MCLPAAADTIEPSSGPAINGTVMKYANSSFTIRGADGQSHAYSSNSIKRIAFDARAIPTRVKSRVKGALQGKVSAYENGGFIFEGATGVEKLPAIFVEQIDFGGDRGPAIDVITKGSQVDLASHLAAGSITIVDFYADWCGPCRLMSPTLEQIAHSDPDVALRKIDIVNWESPVAKQYHVNSIPRVEVYNRAGKLVGTVRGVSPDQVRQYVAQAKSGG
jgi:thiol-disulfide isomerase/thioredoxin